MTRVVSQRSSDSIGVTVSSLVRWGRSGDAGLVLRMIDHDGSAERRTLALDARSGPRRPGGAAPPDQSSNEER